MELNPCQHKFKETWQIMFVCEKCGHSPGIEGEVLEEYFKTCIDWHTKRCCSRYPNCIHNPKFNEIRQPTWIEPVLDKYDQKHPTYSLRCDEMMADIRREWNKNHKLNEYIADYSFRKIAMPIIQKHLDDLISKFGTPKERLVEFKRNDVVDFLHNEFKLSPKESILYGEGICQRFGIKERLVRWPEKLPRNHVCYDTYGNGYNEAIDDCIKAAEQAGAMPEVKWEEIKKKISAFADNLWENKHRNIHEIDHEDLAKAIAEHLNGKGKK